MQDRTLIIEDVLLLVLDDRTGAPAGAGTLHHTLAAVVLAGLVLLGRIRPDGNRACYRDTKVVATGAGPLPDPLLQSAQSGSWESSPRRACRPRTPAEHWVAVALNIAVTQTAAATAAVTVTTKSQ